MRELHTPSLRSLAFACLNMRREDAFSANALSADMARMATTAMADKVARRVLIFLTIAIVQLIVAADNLFFTISIDSKYRLQTIIDGRWLWFDFTSSWSLDAMWQSREVVAECERMHSTQQLESCAIKCCPILGDTSCAKRMLCWSVERGVFCVSGLAVARR